MHRWLPARSKRRLAEAAVVVCVAFVAASCTGAPHTPPKPRATTTTAPALSTTTSAPRPSVPTGTPVPSGFQPGSVTFVSPSTGFVIGIDSTCPAVSCVALARTSDGGSSWVALPAPAAGYVNRFLAASSVPPVSQVRFADELDGWIYGPSLFATHDGGATWQQVDLGGSVVSLETSGGYVDAVVSSCSGVQECSGPLRLEQAPADGGAFETVLTGPSVESSGQVVPALSLHAPVGFASLNPVSQPGQTGLYATQDLAKASGWNPFPDPCAVSSGYFRTAFVAPDAVSLYTLCGGQGAAGSVMKAVVKTRNGKSGVVGTPPPGGDPEELAATSSGTLVVSAASGASELYRSTDGGSTWTTATYNDGGVGFNDLGFTTASQGVVVHGQPGPPSMIASQLLMTFNSGASWQAVAIG